MVKLTKKFQKFCDGLDDHGVRMMQVMIWALDIYYGDDETPEDWQQILANGHCYSEINGRPEEWNKAVGFIHSYWDGGGNISPYSRDYDFSELVREKWHGAYDEGWSGDIYDQDGLQRSVQIKATLKKGKPPGETYDDWLKNEQERLKAAAAAKAKAKARKAKAAAKKAAAKKSAMAKLTPEERKALGIK